MIHQQFIACFTMPRLIYFVVIVVSVNILAAVANKNIDPGKPLFLSPLIAGGEIYKAQKAALVHEFYPVCGYSGFITVNATHNSNLFFWFFPAEGRQGGDNTAPVILWNDGGPGVSGFFSIFNQNGPFIVTVCGDNYTLNPFSWHKKYNMIFMDNPVEVGYSFTENEAGYVTSAPEAARDMYEFLTQFFILFPHFRKNPFYNAGVSYGATYAIQTANYIHQRNLENPRVFISLKGVIVDSPYIDSNTQVDFGDYLFNVGLVSETERDYLREQQAEFRSLVDQERYLDSDSIWKQISQLTFNFTGFGALDNIYNDTLLPVDMTNFTTLNETRKAIHVGSLNYSVDGTKQQSRMLANIMRSSKPDMETLLAAGYRFLLYVGNMDCLTGHLGVQKLLKSVSWEGASDLVRGPKTIWKENGRVAGYNMTVTNMTFLIVRNAGHCCPIEQPTQCGWQVPLVKVLIDFL